ncbi:MAG: hypothetical protein COW34_06155 [Armatimonadetes bacterium CG17_big_fil_post_rev_8_21_14_2_50_66_6]|nr:MAG: hypothetical protein COW34_06155 [Armatimonadetes bacterium CG17_big_fil_post_rev_8_21_14_2_50_66_6]
MVLPTNPNTTDARLTCSASALRRHRVDTGPLPSRGAGRLRRAPRRVRPGVLAFTLLELTLALFLMAVLIGGLTMSLGNGLNAWERGKLQSSRAQEVRVAMDLLAGDLRNAVLSPDRPLTWFVGTDQSDLNGDHDELSCTTDSQPLELYLGVNPTSADATAPTSDLAEVQYRVELSDPSNGGLIRRRQNPPDEDQEAGGDEAVVSKWVTSLNLRYYDGEQFVDDWETSEENQQLPLSVEILCTFQPVDTDQPVVPLTYRTVVPILRATRSQQQ